MSYPSLHSQTNQDLEQGYTVLNGVKAGLTRLKGLNGIKRD